MTESAESTESTEAPPKKKGSRAWVFLLIGAISAGSGFGAPYVLFGKSSNSAEEAPVSEEKRVIPFDSVAVNLSSTQLNRYLRVKVSLVVSESHEEDITALVEKKKPFLKNWLIAYLSDQTLPDVTGAVGVNHIRRIVRGQFNVLLFPDGSEKITDVLFEEFLIQ